MSDSTLLFLCVTLGPWIAVFVWIKLFQWLRPNHAKTLPGMNIKKMLETELMTQDQPEEARA